MSFEFIYNTTSLSGAKDIKMEEMKDRFNTFAVNKISYLSENREWRKNRFILEVVVGGSEDVFLNAISISDRHGSGDICTYRKITTKGAEVIQATVTAIQRPTRGTLTDKEGAEQISIAIYKIDVLLDDRVVEQN
jgi:hypothetical protein